MAGPERNGISYNKIFRIYGLDFGYMEFFEAIEAGLRGCKTDGINAHTICDHILRKIQEEFKGVVT